MAFSNQHYIPIYSTATYDATKLEQINSAEKLRYEFTLYKKTDDDGAVNYVQVDNDDLSNYLRQNQFKIKVTNGLADETEYTISPANGTFTHDYTLGNNDKSGDYVADVYFEVYTGGNFHEYANYRMKLKVSLIKTENSTESELASAESWIVYTNAKIDPSMHN